LAVSLTAVETEGDEADTVPRAGGPGVSTDVAAAAANTPPRADAREAPEKDGAVTGATAGAFPRAARREALGDTGAAADTKAANAIAERCQQDQYAERQGKDWVVTDLGD